MTQAAILFVDDDPNILRGLKRMLREKRTVWDMAFVDGGSAALAEMESRPFDVVVTDMRMPGMDGAELLETVRRRYPATTRIILSGYAEEEGILRTVGPAHRYLSKPCTPDALVESITSALNLRQFLAGEKLQALVASFESLPSAPDVFMALMDELRSETSSTSAVSEILSRDVAMTAETLKLTNSAFFALPTKVADLDHAVRLLGLDTIRALTLISGIYSKFEGDSQAAKIIHLLSERSLVLGVISRTIAEAEGLEALEIQEALCAGVLAHIGTLMLVANFPKKFEAAMTDVENGVEAVFEAERRVFGAGHPELGAYLLGLWGFVDTVVEAVAHHHEPRFYKGRGNRFIGIVHCAQAFAKISNTDVSGENSLDLMDTEFLHTTGQIDRIPEWERLALTVLTREENQ